MTKTFYLVGRQYSNTNNLVEYEKVNPKNKKLVKITKGTCNICGRNKIKFLLRKGLKARIFLKGENVKTIIVHLCEIQHDVI